MCDRVRIPKKTPGWWPGGRRGSGGAAARHAPAASRAPAGVYRPAAAIDGASSAAARRRRRSCGGIPRRGRGRGTPAGRPPVRGHVPAAHQTGTGAREERGGREEAADLGWIFRRPPAAQPPARARGLKQGKHARRAAAILDAARTEKRVLKRINRATIESRRALYQCLYNCRFHIDFSFRSVLGTATLRSYIFPDLVFC